MSLNLECLLKKGDSKRSGGVEQMGRRLSMLKRLWRGAGFGGTAAATSALPPKPKPQGVCVLCGKRELLDHLLCACACAKKADASRLHKQCLERLLNASDSDDPLRCPTCREPYRVKIQYNFKLMRSRCCSMRALSHAFEFVVVIIMIFCCFTTVHFAMRINGGSKAAQSEPSFARYLIYFLGALTIALIPLTLWRVYGRWRKANADVEILDIV